MTPHLGPLLIGSLVLVLLTSWVAIHGSANQNEARLALNAEPLATCGRRPAFRRPKNAGNATRTRTPRIDQATNTRRASNRAPPRRPNNSSRPAVRNPRPARRSINLARPKKIPFPPIGPDGHLYRDHDHSEDDDDDDDNDDADDADDDEFEDSADDSKPNRVKSLIYGGIAARPGQFPSYVKIGVHPYDIENTLTACGGTLIGPRTVVTAAHCLPAIRSVETTRIVVGVNSPGGSRKKAYKVKRICHSEEFCYLTETTEDSNGREHESALPLYDMLFIELADNVTYNDYVQPACISYGLPAILKNDQKDVYEATGLGHTSERLPNDKLLFSRFRQKCNYTADLDEYRQFGAPVECYTGVKNSHTCQGDSGGPIYYTRRMEQFPGPKQFLAGIISFGVEACKDHGQVEGYAVDLAGYETLVSGLVGKCYQDRVVIDCEQQLLEREKANSSNVESNNVTSSVKLMQRRNNFRRRIN